MPDALRRGGRDLARILRIRVPNIGADIGAEDAARVWSDGVRRAVIGDRRQDSAVDVPDFEDLFLVRAGGAGLRFVVALIRCYP